MIKEPGFHPAQNVDEYLRMLPVAERKMLQQLREAIKSAAPKAEELISYNMPTYKYFGALVHFAAFKNHCSFVVVSKTVAGVFKKELSVYKNSGRTIHFTTAKPITAALVKKIVSYQVMENEELHAIKKLAASGKK